ncbi:hypothetical protein [Streptosporangium sp. NPDC002524]
MLAADHRRKKPRTVKRPEWVRAPSEGKTGMDRAFSVLEASTRVIS